MFSWLRLRYLRRKAQKWERRQQRRQWRSADGSVVITASGPGTVIAANTINGNLTITNGQVSIENDEDDHGS
jgi:hypothetical protein